MIPYKKATRRQSHLFLAISGPAGSGKTLSGIRIATGIRNLEGGEIAIIDTEHGKSENYADRYEFSIARPTGKSIEELTTAVHYAAVSGFSIIIIDTSSHAWIDTRDRIDAYTGAKNAAWTKAFALQEEFLSLLRSYPGHVIITMRTKSERVITDRDASASVSRVGLDPQQSRDIEYEVDFHMELSPSDHIGRITKDNTGHFQDRAFHFPDESLGQEFSDVLSEGEPLRKSDFEMKIEQIRSIHAAIMSYADENHEYIAEHTHSWLKESIFHAVENKAPFDYLERIETRIHDVVRQRKAQIQKEAEKSAREEKSEKAKKKSRKNAPSDDTGEGDASAPPPEEQRGKEPEVPAEDSGLY